MGIETLKPCESRCFYYRLSYLGRQPARGGLYFAQVTLVALASGLPHRQRNRICRRKWNSIKRWIYRYSIIIFLSQSYWLLNIYFSLCWDTSIHMISLTISKINNTSDLCVKRNNGLVFLVKTTINYNTVNTISQTITIFLINCIN